MPPKAKFSREEIVDAAFEIIRSDGLKALTARALGESLNSSARPIFTVFRNMEQVEREAIGAARALYSEYVGRGLRAKLPFKGVGEQYIAFAREEPRLFHILFMTKQDEMPGIDNILSQIEGSYELILRSVEDSYSLDRESALWLYRHLWIYTHGIATLCATGMCVFSDRELGDMLTDVFTGLYIKLKGEKGNA